VELLEHQLLRQARDGDYDAFEQLHALLEAPIRRFVQRLVGVSPSVDDIVQTTFISLYRNLKNIDPVENLRPYLFRIARNRCYDELRSQGRFEMVNFDDDDKPFQIRLSFTGESQPEDAAHWVLLYMEVQQAVNQLPELQRQTLILYADEGLSYAEIAVVMETNIGTVKSRLFQARKTLKRLLRPQTLQAVAAELEDNVLQVHQRSYTDVMSENEGGKHGRQHTQRLESTHDCTQSAGAGSREERVDRRIRRHG
jgi:RNA polymerase sigma-70 factor (ECF subfamily)